MRISDEELDRMIRQNSGTRTLEDLVLIKALLDLQDARRALAEIREIQDDVTITWEESGQKIWAVLEVYDVK